MLLGSPKYRHLLKCVRQLSEEKSPGFYPPNDTTPKQEFAAAIEDLEESEVVDLLSLFLLGRGDESCFRCAYKSAASLAKSSTRLNLPEYLASKGSLDRYLDKAQSLINSGECYEECSLCEKEQEEEQQREMEKENQRQYEQEERRQQKLEKKRQEKRERRIKRKLNSGSLGSMDSNRPIKNFSPEQLGEAIGKALSELTGKPYKVKVDALDFESGSSSATETTLMELRVDGESERARILRESREARGR